MEDIIVYYNSIEVSLPIELLEDCHHQGECYEDCERWGEEVEKELQSISDKDLVNHLLEYGAWEEEELQNRKENLIKFLWIAAGDYQDGLFSE
jgi:hypothetical protein